MLIIVKKYQMKKYFSLFLFILIASFAAYAQDRSISGIVIDNNGEPLTGATVVVTATKAYSITDIEGKFSVKAKTGQEIVVSYLGFEDLSLVLDSREVYRISLSPAAAVMLNEAVMIGYGSTSKKEVTGSVASLKSDDFDKGAFTSAAGMLQGKVAGLSVTNPNGGDPNAKFEILLRGTNTLSAGQGPLVIIDGVADADIGNINFKDVESVDILKDGSAAAIYGTRGSNGVLIITTKRAKAGRTSVEYDGQVSVQTVMSRAMPMNARQFEYAIRNFMPASVASLYGNDTDWFKEITRTPVSHKHTLSVSGGSSDFSHRTVINIEHNEGLQKKNDSEKYLFKTNVRQSAIEGLLDLDYNLSYVMRKYSPADYDAFRQAFLHNPTEPVYDPSDTESGGYKRIVGMDYYNPLAMVNERDIENETDNIRASVRATLNILPVEGLKWDNFLSYKREKFESRYYRTKYYPSLIGKDGKAEIENSTSADIQWESTLQYKKNIDAHSIQALAGYTYQESDFRSSSMENYGFDNDFYMTNNIGKGSAIKTGMAGMDSFRESNKYIAFFARVIYNFDEKYLASVSVRRDGSSRFGVNNKWGWFPAVSLGWRINKEEWLKDLSWLNELKLRAGFGVTGNQDFANYKSMLIMQAKGFFYSNGKWLSSYAPASNANPELAWEKKAEYNVGIDFAILNSRLYGTIDYYYRKTSDLLYNYNVPVPPYDYDTIFTNVGSISNSGIEFTLNAVAVQSHDFSWNSSLTLASNANKLIKFTNDKFKDGEYKIGWISTPVGAYCQKLVEGESLGSFYGPTWLMVDPDTGKDKLANAIAGSVAESDWTNIGNAYPLVTIGWSNNLKYKNWSLGASFRGSLGGKVFNNYRAEFENINGIGLKNIMASWLDDTRFTGPVTYSSKYLEDASYLKLDNLSLTYTLPVDGKILRKATLYASAQNVFCLTKYKGVDPEVSLSGLTPGIERTAYYPRTRIFTLGATLNF